VTANARQILAISAAVRVAIIDAVGGRCPIEITVARVMAAVADPVDQAGPAERPSELNRQQNAKAMTQIAVLERQGKSRHAASIVARRLALDPADPAEIWTLAQRFRRLRRSRK
jgi:hypothetical protein